MKIYNYSNLKDIDVYHTRDSIKKDAYSVIRGLFNENDIFKKRKFLEKSFKHNNDIKHDSKDVHLTKKNIQKLVIGNGEGVWASLSKKKKSF